MDVFRADNTVKNLRNLPISNPKPDLQNINAHTEFGVNPLTFTQVIIRIQKYGRTDGRNIVWRGIKIERVPAPKSVLILRCLLTEALVIVEQARDDTD